MAIARALRVRGLMSCSRRSRARRASLSQMAQDKLLFDNSYFKDGLHVESAAFRRQESRLVV